MPRDSYPAARFWASQNVLAEREITLFRENIEQENASFLAAFAARTKFACRSRRAQANSDVDGDPNEWGRHSAQLRTSL
jgi:hypothetical protein